MLFTYSVYIQVNRLRSGDGQVIADGQVDKFGGHGPWFHGHERVQHFLVNVCVKVFFIFEIYSMLGVRTSLLIFSSGVKYRNLKLIDKARMTVRNGFLGKYTKIDVLVDFCWDPAIKKRV